MPTLPPGKLTFGQIRDLALRRIGNTGLAVDAGVLLSQLLYERYMETDWPFLFTAAAVTINGPTFPLPVDFLKPQDDRAFLLQTFDGGLTGGVVILEEDRETFDAFAAPGTARGMPQRWTADRNAGLGLVYPDPSGHVGAATLRYKQMPTAETTPPPATTPSANDALVPIFPHHLFLVQDLFVLLLQAENDPRADTEEGRRDKQLQVLLGTALPLRATPPVIPLDPEIFRPNFTGD
jgi:hypothetical protein